MSKISSSSKSHSTSRPAAKRSHHTWPRYTAPRTHFEDFLREIGAPAHSCNLCCVPKQAPVLNRNSTGRQASTVGTGEEFSDGRPIQWSHRTTGTADFIPHARGTQGSAWFSLGVAYPSRRTLSRFPTSSLVKSGGLSSIFKSKPLSAVDTHFCLVLRADVDRSLSARLCLRSLLGEDRDEDTALSHEYTEPYDTVHIHTSFDDATQNSDRPASPVPDIRPISRSASSESLETASSSEAPATPPTHSPTFSNFSPVLADLERSSRFRIEAPGSCTNDKGDAALIDCAERF
ncbi:hypothetical protein SCP_0701160 [Sparassis crispa]|uniref:Uncharacterized protein n=1 Tax=Sparassis crispa TaxID=139825 RepID=A0A401GT70_9APHY|nr:hypothetical protein SCP_0701160 [Sparassis crispa]GBE84934.1 hypothetical protein SCP_0701160 [Sparassis crispa]